MTDPKQMTPEYLTALLASRQGGSGQTRNHENESYQEYQFYNCHQSKYQLLESLL